jgi:hypothetical protein
VGLGAVADETVLSGMLGLADQGEVLGDVGGLLK